MPSPTAKGERPLASGAAGAMSWVASNLSTLGAYVIESL